MDDTNINKRRNFVAKHQGINKAGVHKDVKKATKKGYRKGRYSRGWEDECYTHE